MPNLLDPLLLILRCCLDIGTQKSRNLDVKVAQSGEVNLQSTRSEPPQIHAIQIWLNIRRENGCEGALFVLLMVEGPPFEPLMDLLY